MAELEYLDVQMQPHYDVTYYDDWLDVEDFVTVPAESEAEARETFREEAERPEDFEIQSVEHVFDLPKTPL